MKRRGSQRSVQIWKRSSLTFSTPGEMKCQLGTHWKEISDPFQIFPAILFCAKPPIYSSMLLNLYPCWMASKSWLCLKWTILQNPEITDFLHTSSSFSLACVYFFVFFYVLCRRFMSDFLKSWVLQSTLGISWDVPANIIVLPVAVGSIPDLFSNCSRQALPSQRASKPLDSSRLQRRVTNGSWFPAQKAGPSQSFIKSYII